MLGFNKISLKIKSSFAALSAIRAAFDLWLDSGLGGIGTPWDDNDTWIE